MKHRFIQVYEYECLRVGQLFTRKHFERLVLYNEKNGNKYFNVGNDRVYFKQYVGVIQVGNLTIEILPKVDKAGSVESESKSRWHDVLVDMLHESGFIRLENLTDSRLKLRSSNLLDIFLHVFLNEVSRLIHEGLIKNYRLEEGNQKALKGRLVFPVNISKNFIHKERFYTAHNIYDRDNIFNRILNEALDVLNTVTNNQSLIHRSSVLKLAFEGVSSFKASENTFRNLSYNRKSDHYKYAINLAKLIILNFSPDIKSGKENVLAILFDMNTLFERYVYKRLKKEEKNYSGNKLSVKAQTRHKFWEEKSIRPDIVLSYENNGVPTCIIIDTKWKLGDYGGPADADLKQMFVYNIHLNASHSMLVYPSNSEVPEIAYYKPFRPSPMLEGKTHFCGQYFIDVIDSRGKLKKGIGNDLIKRIFSITSS